MKVQRLQPPCLAADVVAPGADSVAAIPPPDGQRLLHDAAPGGGSCIGFLRQEAELIGQLYLPGHFMRTDTGQATGLGLHGNDAQPLPAGGQQKQVHGAQKLRHVRAHAQKAQTVPQAQPVSLVLYLRAKRPVSGQQKHGIRPAPVKFRENIQQKPVVFLLCEPAHMADDCGLLRNGQLPAQAETVLRRKGKGLRINFFAALTVHSGQRLLFDAATLQLTANGYDFYAVLNIHNVNNVTVEGGLTIIGDRESHTATTGESGHGIRVVNSHNVHVSDVDIRYTWGDGVCVGGNGTMAEISQNVTLERIRTYKCSRNGLSIIEADGVVVRDCDFTYTDRTAPQYGIDVEPNLGTATNITIENVRMLDNGIGGFALYTTKATLPGVLTLRNIETDAKTIIYTSSAAGGTFDVRVDGWRHTQKSGETNPTLRLSGKGSLRIRQLYVVNKSANRVIIPLDIENLRMDGVTVEDDPAVSIKGTLSVQSAVNTSIGKAVITGFLSRNPAEETWYSGNQLTVDNLQDTVVNLNEHLTTGGSSESYKLLLCDKALVLGTALSAKARVFIPYTYGNVNPFRVVNTTATEVQLYTTVSAGITFVGDVPGGSSANSAALTGNASYEVTPMLASGLVYVRKLNTRVPAKTSEITNDSGYQTAAQVESAVTGKGYQTAAQVGAAITAAVGAAMEASY